MDASHKGITTSSISPDWSIYHSDIQNKVEELASICGTPSPQRIKNSLMQKNGA